MRRDVRRKYIVEMEVGGFSGPPVVDQGIDKLDVNVGETVILTCKILSGTGNISFNWQIGGILVPDGAYSPSVLVRTRGRKCK